MRILLVNDKFPPETEAVGSVVDDLAHACAREGHDVTVFTTHELAVSTRMTRESRDELEVVSIPRGERSAFARSWVPLWDPTMLRPFERFVNESAYDVIHFHNVHQHLSFPMVRIARASGAATFLTAHDVMLFNYGKLIEYIDPMNPARPTSPDYRVTAWQQIRRFRKWYNPFRRALVRRALRPLTALFAVSDALRQALLQNGVRADDVIYNGLDLSRWRPDADAIVRFRRAQGLVERKVVMFGGRLSVWKGGEQILRAMAPVVARVPDAVLLVVGDGTDYGDAMHTTAERLGVASRVVFTGVLRRDQMPVAYGASDVVVVPSVCFDSLPTMVLEAMACRKPVVATCFGGAPEVVMDNATGFVVNPYDVEALANRIVELLQDDLRARAFGESGRKRVEASFSQEHWARQVLRRYRQGWRETGDRTASPSRPLRIG
jgi:glycosyltransferase involved in cell wall biosynthesis